MVDIWQLIISVNHYYENLVANTQNKGGNDYET